MSASRKVGWMTAWSALWLSGCTSMWLGIMNAGTPARGHTGRVDIAYAGEEGPRLDVYVPAPTDSKPAGPAAVVVFFHGGRWSYGHKDQYRFVGRGLAAHGIVTVIASYRLYPQVKFPTFVEDAAAAVAWTRANISEFGGDPERIFVMGHSAGAHISALLTFDERYLAAVGEKPSSLAGMIGLAGPYDFLPIREDDLRDMFGPEEDHPESQPIRFVDGSEPEALLLHGNRDKTVGRHNSRNLAARITEAGGAVQTKYYADLDHSRILAALASPFLWMGPVRGDVVGFVVGEGVGGRSD